MTNDLPKSRTDTTEAERVALAMHLLVLCRRLESLAGSMAAQVDDRQKPWDYVTDVELTALLINRVSDTARKLARVGWPRGFDKARRVGVGLTKAWKQQRELRHSIEHAAERVGNFQHSSRGQPTGSQRVLGEEIPSLQSGCIGGASGLDFAWLLGRKYDLRNVSKDVRELERTLSALLVEGEGAQAGWRQAPLSGSPPI